METEPQMAVFYEKKQVIQCAECVSFYCEKAPSEKNLRKTNTYKMYGCTNFRPVSASDNSQEMEINKQCDNDTDPGHQGQVFRLSRRTCVNFDKLICLPEIECFLANILAIQHISTVIYTYQ